MAVLNATAVGREVVHSGGTRLVQALQAGGVRQAAQAIPSKAGSATLLHAYRVGFSCTLNELLVIGAILAFAGSLLALALVRQKDFVPSYAGDGAPGGGAALSSEPTPAAVA